MDLLEKYLEREPLGAGLSYPDLEEAALREVLKLSSASIAPVVEEIESDYQTRKKRVESTYEKSKEELGNKYKRQTDELEPKAREQAEKIQKEHDAQKQGLIARTKHDKEEAASNAKSELAYFKENYEYEIMIAGVVEEGSIKRCRKNMAQIKESVSSAKSVLEQLYESTKQVCANYKVSVDEKPGKPAEKEIETQQDPMGFFRKQKEDIEVHLLALSELFLPKVFLNVGCYVIGVVICVIFAGAIWLVSWKMGWGGTEFWLISGGGLLFLIVVLVLCGRFLRKKARSAIMHHFEIISDDIGAANAVLDKHIQDSLERTEREIVQAKEQHEKEEQAAKGKYAKLKAASELKSKTLIKNTNEQYNREYSALKERLNKGLADIEQEKDEKQKAYKKEYDDRAAEIEKDFTEKTELIESSYSSARQRLKECWLDRLNIVKTMLAETEKLDESLFYDWENPTWSDWKPEEAHKQLIRFGKIGLDLKQIAEPVRELTEAGFKDGEGVTLPAVLAFPNRCSLLIQSPHTAREAAISLVKAVMARLFTCEPAGQVHFNIFDPIGLGKSFVGFMHAVDYQKALVGGRIWTDSEHIQRCLTELTTHMENVIQKYLRNEFETIEAYNLQAGELAEPYRFLVIADFPTNFNDESIRRLSSIINSGPRCGVYTLMVCDESQKLPEKISARDLASNGVHLVYRKGHFVWQNETLKKFQLEPDGPPSEELLTDLVCKVGVASIDSARVEVPFETIAPAENDRWSEDSTFGIKIPIGRAGAKRLQYLQLGKGVNQHMLIAGKTGSGKSTLFHVIITNSALWYSPDEVELYLIDFKQGVEFKTYAVHKLPHTRAVAIESDREFGLSILQRLDAEMAVRGDKFRQARVQDIPSYRQTTGEKMPRTILIIDEFHILFTEDDRIAHEAATLLEKLVRQGRAFGIHVILGSQSLAGTSGISRSIMGQMAVRIALQCSEMDSQIILNEDNVVARLLSRAGEAIYNDAGGMVVGNNPFQVAWLPKIAQDDQLSNIHKFSKELVLRHEPMIVFEGNIPADISNNAVLAKLMRNPFTNIEPVKQPPRTWLGEPVTIKEPTAVIWHRQNGANLLVIGQQDFAMAGVLSSALLSLLVQLSPQVSRFIILDDSPASSPIGSKLKSIEHLFPDRCRFARSGQIADVISELAIEVKRRLESGSHNNQTQFLLISGLQRFRMLYRKDDDWSFRPDEEKVSIDRQLADILCGGPSIGIHTIIGADTFNTVERVVDRQTLREFNNRVLFQMSASDSSNLIDSPVANQLGPQRALFYDAEQGILEKFRFYAPPDEHWLREKCGSIKTN